MRIHTQVAGDAGLFVNAYAVETAEAVVVIDTSLLVDDTAEFVARVNALGKPLAAVLLTHPHPDHFNGAIQFARTDDVPVLATAAVARTIREIADAKRAQWSPTYGDQWPEATYFPNTLLGDGEPIRIGGLSIVAHDLGPGESHADSVLVVRAADEPQTAPVAFIGDLAFHGTHSYTADGHTTAWLSSLDKAATLLADASLLYPGHGAPGTLGLLELQRDYLSVYRAAVADLADRRAAVDDASTAELVARMVRHTPGAPLDWLIALGADAVAAELAREGR
jgi:glyoxylase-like metal-dependent hydrolase (beta-lactamase superfamily II)